MRGNVLVLLMFLLAAARPAAAQDNCDYYANVLLDQIARYDQMQCQIPPAPDFWVRDREALRSDCARQGEQSQVYANGNLEIGQRVLHECARTLEAGGAGVATVNGDVDLYDNPGGEGAVIGIVRQGQTFDRFRCLPNNWCQVRGGWIWGDFLDR